jgi:hypothetical protein
MKSLIVQAVLSGASAALVVQGVWLIAVGHPASFLTVFVVGEIATTVWSLWQAARFRRRWQALLAAYRQPALGEGIDIPHRPPADDEA